MATNKLTLSQIKDLPQKARPFKVADGQGLLLLINPNGAKWWRFVYRYAGKQKQLSFGVYPEVTLAEARKRRQHARQLLRDGIDPSAARQAERQLQASAAADSFSVVAIEFVAKNAPTWSPSTLQQVESRLRRDILPYLGPRPIASIHAADVLQVCQRIIDRGALDLARRCLRIQKQILQHGLITRRIDVNPAAGLSEALPSTRVQHMASLTDPEAVAGLLRAIDGYQGEPVTRAALQLAPLVFVRPGELRGAVWQEIDLESARWEIPAERTKMNEPLIVPLSRQALAIFRELQPLTGAAPFVFHGARSKTRPISDNTLNAALRRMGFTKQEMTAHGFRAMARTLLDEQLGFRYELIEQQLGHQVRDPNGRAYNRTRHLADRAKMMQAWADYLDRLKAGRGNVRELRERA